MSDLASDGVTKFFLKQKPRLYKKGQIVIHPDEPSNGIYYIEKGFIKAYSLTENGGEKCHIFFKTGEIFPLVATFRNLGRHAFFETMDDTIIRKADKEEFMDYIKSSHLYLLDVIDRIIIILAAYVDRVDNLEYTKAYSRLIQRLLLMSERFGKEYNGSVILEIPVTHKDIANTISLTRETTSRELLKLEKKKLITQKGHTLVVNNVEKLRKELENSL